MKAKDLAKKLGVSPATISLVLNNKPGISDSLRKSLLEKIQELGHEEMLCESCRTGKAPGSPPAERPAENNQGGCACNIIAYLIYQEDDCTDMHNPYNFFTGVLEGVEAEAWENDCCLVMVHANKHKDVSVAEQLRRAGNVIGVIVHPCGLSPQLRLDMEQAKVPFVFLDFFATSDWEPPSVCISNRQGMQTAVSYLHKKGHRRLGYIYSGWETPVEADRRRQFLGAAKECGLTVREEDLFCSGTGEELFEFQRLARLFENASQLPTALVCENDRQAWRAVKALEQIGKRVPEDVSLIGFDDIALCTKVEPNLTSIHNSPQLMGREAVMMVKNLNRLRELGEKNPWLRYELPARLVERDSVQDLGEGRE